MGRPWIKLSTSMFDDEKIKLIELMPEGDSLLVIWLKLLCFAGKTDNDGVFRLNKEIPYNAEMLAGIFNRKLSTVRTALDVFQEFGMVTIIDDAYALSNWPKYQSDSDALAKSQEKNRLRQKKWYDKHKKPLFESSSRKPNVRSNDSNVSLTATEVEEDKELEEELDIEGTTKNNCLSAAAAFNNQYSVNKEVLTREGETTLPNGVKTVEFYNKNVFPLTSSYERERLLDLADEYGDEWCIAACKEAIDHQARSIAYIDKVLRTWRAKGFKSVPGKQETKRDTQYDDIPF